MLNEVPMEDIFINLSSIKGTYAPVNSGHRKGSMPLTSIEFLLHKFSFQDFVSFSIEISFGLQFS
jgi:hypothetical protein